MKEDIIKWTPILAYKFNKNLQIVFDYYGLDYTTIRNNENVHSLFNISIYHFGIPDEKLIFQNQNHLGRNRTREYFKIIQKERPYFAPFYALYYELNPTEELFKQINSIVKKIRKSKSVNKND